MTNENLMIKCDEVFELQKEFPNEMKIILQMLEEAEEGCFYDEQEAELIAA